MDRVRKAIIPAAGLGTRFLPATKTVPKEMLTIVDAPIIFYVVEEAVQAGIEEIVLVQGRGKTAIEDFFDVSYEVEDKLAKDGKIHLLERLIKIREMANIISIRQKQPLGLGHAVLCGQSVIGNHAFAVLLGDEIMVAQPQQLNTTAELCQRYDQTQAPVVAVMEVEPDEVSKYGIADLAGADPTQGHVRVRGFVEKPRPERAPSAWALPGRYVLTPDVFTELANAKPGVLGEIQLTDTLNQLAQSREFYASSFSADRYDAGDKLGYLRANIEIGMRHPELRDSLSHLIEKWARNLESMREGQK